MKNELLVKGIIIYVAAITIYIGAIDPPIMSSGITQPLQQAEASLVAGLQSMLGGDAHLSDTGDVINYPSSGTSLFIGPMCVGVREALIFSILLLLFLGVPLKVKLIGLGVFIPAILIENIARLAILAPVAGSYGRAAMSSVHGAVWLYGQALFLLALFLTWFQFFAKPAIRKVKRSAEEKQKREKAKIE